MSMNVSLHVKKTRYSRSWSLSLTPNYHTTGELFTPAFDLGGFLDMDAHILCCLLTLILRVW